MIGMESIIAIRVAGWRPKAVMVAVAHGRQVSPSDLDGALPWLCVSSTEDVSSLDLRGLLGLDVVVLGLDAPAQVVRICEAAASHGAGKVFGFYGGAAGAGRLIRSECIFASEVPAWPH